jgi:hypothetical protein
LEGTVAIGVDDSRLPGADVTRPLVVAPACGPGAPTPWGSALVRAADAVVLLDPIEARDLRPSLDGRPVVVAALPAPALRAPVRGVDTGGGDTLLGDAWARAAGGGDPEVLDGPGVAWVGGRGLAPLAAALEAWAAGMAVVALPDVRRHDLLRAGRALHATTRLEVLEATRFLLRAPALAAALGARGREVAAALPGPRAVAMAVLEAVELGRQAAESVR